MGLTSLLLAIPLYSTTINPALFTRITAIILLYSAALSLASLDLLAIGSGLGLYSGLFHVSTTTHFIEIFLFLIGAMILLPYPGLTTDHIKDAAEIKEGAGTGPKIAEYSMVILFTTIGASFLIASSDLISMYLSIELQSFAVYILATIYRDSESSTSAGIKYFLLGALSSALILLGSSLIYAYTGLTSFESISSLASVNALGSLPIEFEEQIAGQGMNSLSSSFHDSGVKNAVNQGLILGIILITIGFLFKVAAAPFHNWAPDVYDGVPTIVTTWLTVMPKISIFIFLLGLQIALVWGGSSVSWLSEEFNW